MGNCGNGYFGNAIRAKVGHVSQFERDVCSFVTFCRQSRSSKSSYRLAHAAV